MKLYHGTNVEFDKIDLLKSKPNKDFGCGFYLSAEYAQAKDIIKPRFHHLGLSFSSSMCTFYKAHLQLHLQGHL